MKISIITILTSGIVCMFAAATAFAVDNVMPRTGHIPYNQQNNMIRQSIRSGQLTTLTAGRLEVQHTRVRPTESHLISKNNCELTQRDKAILARIEDGPTQHSNKK